MSEPTTLLLQAIALKLCVAATYNRTALVLAPHMLYTRHGEIYADAVTILRDGYPPREVKLGSYKLAGLRDAVLTERSFEPSRLFDPAAERYAAGATLFAVEF